MPLYLALSLGNPVIWLLIEYRADINIKGGSPQGTFSSSEIVKPLIGHRTDVNVSKIFILF